MKKLLLSIIFLIQILIAFGQKKPQKFEFIEKNFGIYKSNILKKDAIVGTSSIEHSVLDSILLIKKVDRIEAKLGASFGVEYFLKSNFNETIQLDIEWIYPKKIIDPADNEKVKSIRYGIFIPTNYINLSDYKLEKEFEVVKGNWQLNIYFKNKVIYSRIFILE